VSAPVRELLAFALKQARACGFAVLLFGAMFLLPRAGFGPLGRYDLLLLIALLIQALMLLRGLETRDEFKAICLFHALGFGLEVFKTSTGINSWSYPDAAFSKILGVPLFSGFMYASVGSYVIQSWRLMALKVRHHPPYWMAWVVACAIYENFFTHHWIPDLRGYLAAVVLGLYARTTVLFRVQTRQRCMPMLAAFVLIGFCVWLAENLGTFFGVWRYPHQIGAWARVGLGKWSSWSLLVIMTFTLVANLKHVKARIHVAE
jgi:uncharacterized membrane protein YoaT (DUF817 family)